jgi:hypothetical protein
VLARDHFWVALGQTVDLVIAIEASRWPLAMTGLVSADDLSAYEQRPW